jgi:four helix bundle protein
MTATTRPKPPADFISKMSIVEEECDECIYWMELLIASALVEERLLTRRSLQDLLPRLGDTIPKIRNYSTNYPRAEFDETTCSPFPPSPEPFRKA